MKASALRVNSQADVKTLHVLFCRKCQQPLFMCKRCGYSFEQFEKISCDEGHRCHECVKKSKGAA